ncbi:MAG: hypothetical protein O3A82_08690, partial [Verrucomicrobia bacterium]|nr:hypothetical protein [Verrucomicrobiota bacterium]
WRARWVRLRFRDVSPVLSLRARQGVAIRSPHFLSLRGRSRRELTWQSSLKRHVGCRGDAVGCPMVPLDCRVATLLAMTTGGGGGGGGEWRAGWDAIAGLPRRGFAPSRNDKGGTEMGGVGRVRWIAASLRSSQ